MEKEELVKAIEEAIATFSRGETAETKAFRNGYKYALEETKICIEVLQQRIDKAIEYIKKYQRKDEFLNLNEWQTRDLLNILGGKNE